MDRSLEHLIKRYEEIEQSYLVRDDSLKYSSLVTASTNQQYPIQRWFHLKEAYSIDLFPNLLLDWEIDTSSIKKILDPFCGIGTSLLSFQKIAKGLNLKDVQVIGIERNPFLHFVSETKLSWEKYSSEILKADIECVLSDSSHNSVPIPTLTTINRDDVFSKNMLRELLSYKGGIDQVQNFERSLLLLGYASCLEVLSGVRKDGRALRIVPNKQKPAAKQALQSAWSKIADDLSVAQEYFKPLQTQVLFGNGRNLEIENGENINFQDCDVIIYSPPYPNNIDYTEVYKLELWMCGFVDSYEIFRSLRHKTFRSHPSIRFVNPVLIGQDDCMKDVNETLSLLVESLPVDKDYRWRKDLFIGYFDDMYQSLKSQIDILRSGGWIFCIVGNSLHGSEKQAENRVPVAADLIIASIAGALGLEVKAIQVARHLKRRSSGDHFMRESIVVMRKK